MEEAFEVRGADQSIESQGTGAPPDAVAILAFILSECSQDDFGVI